MLLICYHKEKHQKRCQRRFKEFSPNLAKVTTHFDNEENQNLITLAVDNDEAGKKFIERFKEINVPVIPDVPPLSPGQEKNDWNDF